MYIVKNGERKVLYNRTLHSSAVDLSHTESLYVEQANFECKTYTEKCGGHYS